MKALYSFMKVSLYNKSKTFILSVLILSIFFSISPTTISAAPNLEMNYQGKLTDSSGTAVADGTYNMNFWILASSTAATSTNLWEEVRTGGDQVQVTNGLFSVMLGDVTSLASVDFNQALYLGVEIGGTSTPAWDGEMTPRKVLGTVPAAFVAESANTFAGLATTSFLRSDEADTMEATSSSPILTLIQNGAGKVASFFSGATEMFTVLNNGNVGIATTTPDSKLTVAGNTHLQGNLTLTGSLTDSTNATGTNGQILSSTGTSTQWTSTSTLGLGDGTFLGLTDTISSYTANQLLFTNSGGTALTDSANLTFDGIDLGLGDTQGIAFGGTRNYSASSTLWNLMMGVDAGISFNGDVSFSNEYNTVIGFEAGKYSSTTSGFSNSKNNLFGYRAGYNNDGNSNNFIGSRAGYNNTGNDNNVTGIDAGYNNSGTQNNMSGTSAGYDNTGNGNNIIGSYSGESNTGSNNNLFGSSAGRSNTGSDNNLFGAGAGYFNTGSNNNFLGQSTGYDNTGDFNEMIGYQTGRYLQSTSSVLVGTEAFYGGAGNAAFQAINNTALGYRAGYNATTSADNNILLGYQAADNLTSGANNIVLGYDVDIASTTGSNQLNIGNLIFGDNIDGTGTTLSSGNIGIGTTTLTS